VILSVNPAARIIDITHDIPPQDIEAAAFTLLAVYPSFPAGTIHVAVVDPGVGSSRRAILVRARQQYFIGPDNGIFSYICEHTKPRPRIFHLTNTKYFRHPISPTFHGRDVFAPVAAALSTGVKPRELGSEIHDYVRLQSLKAETKQNGEIRGRIIHIDRFGNCITNITKNELTPEMIDGGAKLRVKGELIKSFQNYFAEETKDRSKIFAVWGSAGFLEIAAAGKSAAKILNVRRGDSVVVSARSSESNL
jgi:S-adenosylmethionine hydrolase